MNNEVKLKRGKGGYKKEVDDEKKEEVKKENLKWEIKE